MMVRFLEAQLKPLPLPDSAEAWRSRRDTLRREIRAILGLDDLLPARWSLNIQHKDTLQRDGYRIEKLTYESYPGLAVAGLLYVPDGITGKMPGIVSIGGHAYAYGKAFEQTQHRNVNLALRGCVVFSYDYIDTGESNTGPDPLQGKPYGGGNHHGIRSFSHSRRTATALEVLDGIRALDLLVSRPEVDPQRLGFTGESGASNTTYWVSSLDDRVKLAVPVSSVTTFDYWIRNDRNWDYHQRPPGIRRIADIGTLLALHAPSPLLVITSRRGTDDEEFPVDEAQKSFTWAKHVYDLLGAGDSARFIESSTGHGYQEDKREHLYEWVERNLKPPATRGSRELPTRIETLDELRCGLPQGNLTFHDVFGQWLAPLPRSKAQLDDADKTELRQFLRQRLGWWTDPAAGRVEPRGQEHEGDKSAEFMLLESEPGIQIPCVLFTAGHKNTPIELVPGRDAQTAAAALEKGHRVLAFDPRGTGETKDGGGPVRNWAWFVGRPWPGMRALDIAQAARFCRKNFPDAPRIITATGELGWPALLASAAEPGLLPSGRVSIPFKTLKDQWHEHGDYALADVPGLLERLDIPQLRQLAPGVQVETP